MNKSVIAGAALVAALAVGTPIAAWSADDSPPPPPAAAPMPGPAAGAHHGDGGWDHQRHPGMWHWMHNAQRMTPQQRCEDRLARHIGFRAYIIAKLQLTADQKPLLDKLTAAQQSGDEKKAQLCKTLKPRDERADETLLDKMNRREQVLSVRLQALQQEQPAVQALYQALTPEQKTIVDHPFRR